MKLTIESIGEYTTANLDGVQVIDLTPDCVLMFVLPKDTAINDARRISEFLKSSLREIPFIVVNQGSFDIVVIRPIAA